MAKRVTGVSAIVDSSLATPPPGPPQRSKAVDVYQDEASPRSSGADEEPSCTIKQVPERLLFKAAAIAATINPVNEPVVGRSAAVSEGVLPSPLAIAVATAKYWGPTPRQFTVSFLDATPPELRRRIVRHLDAWSQTSGMRFVETNGTGQVRISRGRGGYWSYLGTDILLIPPGKPTMNLEAFSLGTSESEYHRVVRHEAGHTLGFPHEHMRRQLVALIDPTKAYDYFFRQYQWDRATVDQQVLTPLDDRTIMSTPPDQDSIMCYQLPGTITFNGQPIRGGADINATDFAFAARIYPRAVAAAGSAVCNQAASEDDWPASDDVVDVQLSA